MLKKPAFWVVFVLVSASCIAFGYRYFPLAFPLVSLDITMDRQAALASARRLAEQHGLGPAGFRQAASFALDAEAQNFVELEGGGKEAFGRMLADGLYAAYTWRVRQFKEGETNETLVRFTPDGRPYGFREKIKEDAPGASLAPEAARDLAQRAAREAWRVDLGVYRLVEQSQEVRPGGRVDHTLVYERPDRRLNEGRYRLRLVVSGDRLTEVTYFIKVPEAFSRRFEEMRSANTAITLWSTVGMVLLYLVGGIAIGLFFLLRQRWVVWRRPVLWGVFVALLQFLVALNQWPLLWMTYDTAVSTPSYVARQLAIFAAAFLAAAVLFSLSFMAAESLTRRAFPHHPQFWRVWSRGVAGSPAVLGRTVAGYLLVGVFLAYEVALYFLSSRLLGWWTPSDLLFHPDVLATYLPWLTSIAVSFQAGFWEECLFRAVPLAGAALIGERLGHRTAWLAGAFVVQALVFGAGHAAYATQPAYARVVELIIPSVAFGLLYLRWGLLPAIVLHFTFDVMWFALPLFVSTAPGVWVDRLMVVLLTLVPLWVVLAGRWRAGRWRELAPADLNASWTPPAALVAAPAEAPPLPVGAVLSQRAVRAIVVAGVAGLVAWAAGRQFSSDVPLLSVGRQDAAEAARRVLTEQGVSLSDRWRVLPLPEDGRDQSHRFVWETAGRDRYFELLGRQLDPPHWDVRVATFEGDVAERAEEWQVLVTGQGSVDRIRHQLPESRPGATLTESQARELAHAAIRDRFGIDPDQLEEVSAVPSKLPARTDWALTFTDTTTPALLQGEARLSVSISGDQVAHSRRFVHVPEEWERARRNERTVLTVLQVLGGVALAGILLAGCIGGVVFWSRRNFSVRVFVGTFLVLLLAALFEFVNSWPTLMASLRTAQPLPLQVLSAVGLSLMAVTIPAAVIALSAGVAVRLTAPQRGLGRSDALKVGLALGALAAGAAALVAMAPSGIEPMVPGLAGAGTFVPLAAAAVSPVGGYVLRVAVVLLLFAAADRFTRGWTRRRPLFGALLFGIGLLMGGVESAQTLPLWVAGGAMAGAFLVAAYVFIARFDLALVAITVGAVVVLDQVREAAHGAYPGARAGGLLGVVLVALLAWWWFRELGREQAARLGTGAA